MVQCRGLFSAVDDSHHLLSSSEHSRQLSDRQRLLICSPASRSLGWIRVHCCSLHPALVLMEFWQACCVALRSPCSPRDRKEMHILWNSLWRSCCASEILLLDYFYSYNPNGSLKIKPDVIFCLFSAECSVTVVLPLSLQNTNISWIELDFSVGPVFPRQCHLGLFESWRLQCSPWAALGEASPDSSCTAVRLFPSGGAEGVSQEVALCHPVITCSD